MDTPHPEESHDLINLMERKAVLEASIHKTVDIQDPKIAASLVAAIPNKEMPFTLSANEALGHARAQSELSPVNETQTDSFCYNDPQLQETQVGQRRPDPNRDISENGGRDDPRKKSAMFTQSSDNWGKDEQIPDAVSANHTAEASQASQGASIQRQLTGIHDQDPEARPLPPTEHFLDKCANDPDLTDYDTVDGPMTAASLRQIASSSTKYNPHEQRNEYDHAQQLWGSSLPPSAFATHGDPLCPVQHYTTDADTELAQSVYASPPSMACRQGDPVMMAEPFRSDLFAADFSSTQTSAWPDKFGFSAGVAIDDPYSNSSLAACEDAARGAVLGHGQKNIQTLGGELKPGRMCLASFHSPQDCMHDSGRYGAAHAGDMLPRDEDGCLEAHPSPPPRMLQVHRAPSGSVDGRSSAEVVKNEGMGNPDSVRSFRRDDPAGQDLAHHLLRKLHKTAHAVHLHLARVVPALVGSPNDGHGDTTDSDMPESSPR
jgi:hypothetical protein